MTASTSLTQTFKDYYQKTNAKKIDERGTLVYFSEAWKIVDLTKEKHLAAVFQSTIAKMVSIDLKEIPERELVYWIRQFNSEMAVQLLKNKKITPVTKEAQEVQFNSMNGYAWLSNFFITMVYDPKFKMLYPSVESGYVAFKARQAKKLNPSAQIDVAWFAHCISPKTVKQLGKELWDRRTEADHREAIDEMGRLVALKINQNPVIEKLLKSSSVPLEEFTNDAFWGTAMGTVKNENSNHLGKILERTRAALQTL